jgi:hypothetical protein
MHKVLPQEGDVTTHVNQPVLIELREEPRFFKTPFRLELLSIMSIIRISRGGSNNKSSNNNINNNNG